MQYYNNSSKSSRNITFPTRNSPDDDDEGGSSMSFLMPQVKPYQYYEHTLTAQQIHFYLNKTIEAPDLYSDMIHRINTASAYDTVYIHLNTPGGRLDTGVQILNAMRNSEAKIVTILEAEAFSLGTLIFLAGDELIVNDHCVIMLHNFTGGVRGKGHEQLAELEATVKWFTSIAREIYIPFLTEDEFNRIIKGEDLWLHSKEIRERIEVMFAAEGDTDVGDEVEEVLDEEIEAPRKRKPKQAKTS